ncbi:transcription factor bHLH113 isoform X1 [Carica papaya]|uniref:transcription factor bHLH113 isoform X1 n=1 Tax=Carica papaya TaxID=3649 RepID=UPI000B8CB325|nr:transcription factor bHLH113 isoform X1 [Carica papaya]
MGDGTGGFAGETGRGSTPATSFSQLLFADDEEDDRVVVGLDLDQQGFHYAVSSSENPPKMLCFGAYQSRSEILFGAEGTMQKSGVSCSDSSSASSGNNSTITTLSYSNKKRNVSGSGSGQELAQCPSAAITTTTTAPVAGQRTTNKKTRTENPASVRNTKMRKEKLGERITALQQLVSPFGKTDAASVLHEAMGYIRFLHDQVHVLCSPYLQHLPDDGEIGEEESKMKDLRSRGLCLVPMACTVHVAETNGADLWSPTMGHNVPSSTTKQQGRTV